MKVKLSEKFTYNKLIRFTLPTIIMMIVTTIYGTIDGIFISNIAGKEAFAAVNLVFPPFMIILAFGYMLGSGGTALVAKTLGEGDNKRANSYFSLLTYTLIIISIILSILGLIFLKPLVFMLKSEENMVADCLTYGRMLLLFITGFMLQNFFQNFLVVAEKPRMGLAVSLIAGITNMVLDYLFIYIFGLGTFGSGLATGIASTFGSLVPLVYFIKSKKSQINLTKAKIEIRPILKSSINGSSEMLSNVSMSIVGMIFNSELMRMIGANGVIAYGVILYVGYIFAGVSIGFSIGSSAIVGYNYGAKNYNELRNVLKKSIVIMLVSSIVLTAIAEGASDILARIFVNYDEGLINLTRNAIRLYMTSYLLQGLNIFASGFFTGLNDGFVSAFISTMRILVFQTLSIIIMARLFGLNGIWLSVLVAEILSFIVSLICFIVNRKKYRYI